MISLHSVFRLLYGWVRCCTINACAVLWLNRLVAREYRVRVTLARFPAKLALVYKINKIFRQTFASANVPGVLEQKGLLRDDGKAARRHNSYSVGEG